ncbi:MAG: undecaprenyl-diphosphatase UppP [Candidatus Latescibacteria bacterium]|nr:undecaprenyl-diphosphatase UppP [Candidatus Latescibacterota bacterium]
MNTLQALVLGLVQGLTEFIPISSTAHLRIVPHFLGWDDPGAAFSAVIQLGSLLALFTYFAADIWKLLLAALASLRHRNLDHSPDSRLAWSIAVGTLPISVLGLAFKDFIEGGARQLTLIALALIALALFLLLAERLGRRTRLMQELGFWQIQFIGLCQALALIPGCSRSGSTIMGGLFLGLRREEAARFSFLLGLPAIGAGGVLEFLELLKGGLGGERLFNLEVGVVAAAVSSYLSIGFLLRFLQSHGTHWFAWYRILLGALILFTLS